MQISSELLESINKNPAQTKNKTLSGKTQSMNSHPQPLFGQDSQNRSMKVVSAIRLHKVRLTPLLRDDMKGTDPAVS